MGILESWENRGTLGIVASSVLQVLMEPGERKVIVVFQVFQERWSGITDS